MEKGKEYTQPSFLNQDGSPNQRIVDAVELNDTFHTEEQVTRARDLIASGLATNAKDAWRIMAEEDANTPVNDAHTK